MRGLRGRSAVVLVVVVLAAAFGVVALLSSGGGGGKGGARKELVAYQDKLLPLAQEWGKIEVQGMRPAITDLESEGEGVPAEAIAVEAENWESALVGLRGKIAALATPSSMRRAKVLFDQAIVRYIDAARLFHDAAAAPIDARQAGILKGIDAARDGARLYNEASLVLQRARKSVGLPATPDFPDHPAGDVTIE